MIPFEHEGVTVNYSIEGKGRALVFVHGFLEDARMWSTITPHFVNRFKVTTIDLPGHGSNANLTRPYSLKEVGEAINALLQKLAISNPYVIGHSMGGYVGLCMAQISPINLVLLHSNFWEDSEEKKKDRNRVIELVNNHKNRFIAEAIPNLFDPNNKAENKAQIKTLIERAQEMSVKAISLATAAMRDRNRMDQNLENLTIIQGENDPIIRTEILLEETKKLNPKPNMFILEKCGHMSIWEKEKSLINLMESILIP